MYYLRPNGSVLISPNLQCQTILGNVFPHGKKKIISMVCSLDGYNGSPRLITTVENICIISLQRNLEKVEIN